MAEILKEVIENYEKLHRLQMIDALLGTIHGYTREMVSKIEDRFDYCEDSEDFEAMKDIFESIISKVKADINLLEQYL